MNEAEIYREQFRSMSNYVQTQTEDVPEDEMFKRPGPHLNPVGWNYWHLLRVWDVDLNWMAKGQKPTEDAWNRGGFTEKADYNPEGKGRNGIGIGVGYTDAEVDELNFSSDILREYHQQLLAETEEYLQSATDEDFRRELPNPSRSGETVSIGARLQHAIGHSYNHVGELRYAKGLLGHPDPTYPGARD